MNGFEKRAALIKGKIMKTTMGMLNSWETKQLRIADIAKEAGVSQVTIYNYFGSKEGLFAESFKNYISQSIEEFEEEMQQAKTLKELIAYMIFKEKQSYYAFPPALIKEIMIDDVEMYRYIQEQYDKRIMPLMVKMVEEGKAKGEVSDKISVEAFLLLIQVYMKSSGELLQAVDKHEKREVLLEELMHLFFYGLCGREPE